MFHPEQLFAVPGPGSKTSHPSRFFTSRWGLSCLGEQHIRIRDFAGWAPGPRPHGWGFLFADAPRGTCLYDRVSAGSRPRVQTARARIRIQCRPMPRNTLLAFRVPWVSWASMVLIWKA
eukprot:570639-Pyramimonas_sp.AAC.1